MKKLIYLIFGLSLVAFIPARAGCGACGPKPPKAAKAAVEEHGADHAKHSDLHENMEALGDIFKQLSKGIRRDGDAANASEYLDMVAHLQEHLLASKGDVPELVVAIEDAAERSSMTKKFRTQMSTLMIASCQLEVALLEGNMDAAGAALKNMKKIKSEGHDTFTEDEDE